MRVKLITRTLSQFDETYKKLIKLWQSASNGFYSLTSESKTHYLHFVTVWRDFFYVTLNLHGKLLYNLLLVVFHVIFNNEYSFEKVELLLELLKLGKSWRIFKLKKRIHHQETKSTTGEEERVSHLLIIRRNMAAKVIQRAYRSYKTGMPLKKKEKTTAI